MSGAFTYDGNLKRVKQVMDGETIYSVYGRSGVLLHRDNVTENKKTDYIKVAGHSIARVHGGNNIRYAHNDHLGSAISETTPSSQIRWTQNFTPFGEKRDSSGPNITDTEDEEGFTGHISDDKTGLTYMQARYYNPAWGRFLSNDPVGFAPSTPAMFGRYTYVHNDPINATDPTGEFAHILGGAAVGAVFGAAANVAGQLATNGGDLGAINVGDAFGAAAGGALTGATLAAVPTLALTPGGVSAAGALGGAAGSAVGDVANGNSVDVGKAAASAVAGAGGALGGGTLARALGSDLAGNVAAAATGEALGASIEAGTGAIQNAAPAAAAAVGQAVDAMQNLSDPVVPDFEFDEQ